MIHELTGDILLTGAQALAHGVAPHDDFSQGLALSLRERWPAMYKDFRHFCKLHNPDPGGLWAWMGADGTRVINLFTQDPPRRSGSHPGRASLQHVGHCLKALRKHAEAEELTSLALPRLATGVGGMDWSLVLPLIHQHLDSLGIPVMVYTTYHAGQRAREPLGD